MNITVKSVASKLFVAFVAASMLVMLATPAKAATAEELQAQIDALMAQIAALKGGTTAPAATPAAGCTFTRALTVGAQGEDVKCLQTYLTPTYFTNAGGATGYFGPVTAAAVAAWQTANGVTPAAGYFGPVSQAKYTALMAAAPTTPSTDDSDDTDDTTSGDLSGEASLSDVKISDADDSNVEEGQDAADIAEFDVEFSDGDAMVTRVDLVLNNGTRDPWDVFGDVTLSVDGDEVATIDASDKDNYLDDAEGSLRFSGLDIVAMEDDAVTITVSADIQNNLDAADKGDWNVYVAEMRFVDADDVTTTETTVYDLEDSDNATLTGDKAVVTIETEGVDDELIVKTSSDDLDATTLELEDDSKSDMTTIFSYVLDTDDSVNDITVNDIKVSVAATEDGTTGTSTELLINDAMLVIDGVEYDDVTIVDGVTGTYSFDLDGDLVIDAGEKVTVEFQVEFNALAAELEGATVQASTDATDGYDAEGADDLAGAQFDGSATGEEHTLRTQGAVVEVTDDSATLKANTDATTTDDEGVYTLEFDVTAFNGDLYIDDTAVRGLVMGTEGINFVVTTGGSVDATGTAVPTLDSDATLVGGRYKVDEGSTESFTLTVEYDPASSGAYKVQLYSVNYKIDTNGVPNEQQITLPAEDFDTASLTI